MARKKKSKKRWLFVLLLISLAAAAYYFRHWIERQWNEWTHPVQHEHVLHTAEVSENCYHLRQGEKLLYKIKGEQMVTVETRHGGDISAPRLVPSDEDTLEAEEDGEYCLRFGNPLNKNQKVDFTVKRIEPK